MYYIHEDNIICPICKLILESAVSLANCSHNFCQNCITKQLEEVKKCPVCNEPADLPDIKPDSNMRKFVDNRSQAPTFCNECNQFVSKLIQCGHCNSYICESCSKKHYNVIKEEVEKLYRSKAPSLQKDLNSYLNQADNIEGKIKTSTEKALLDLSDCEKDLKKYLRKFEDTEPDIIQDLKFYCEKISDIEQRLADAERNPRMSSYDIKELIREAKSVRGSANEFLEGCQLPKGIKMDEFAAKSLRGIDILKSRSLQY